MDLLGRRGRGCRGHIPLRLGKKGFKGVGVAIIIKFIFQLEKEVSCHHYHNHAQSLPGPNLKNTALHIVPNYYELGQRSHPKP